jgi:hypothetical protein
MIRRFSLASAIFALALPCGAQQPGRIMSTPASAQPTPTIETSMGADNAGAENGTAYASQVNTYLSAPTPGTTTCNAGMTPYPFGLPCAGTNSYVANADWYQVITVTAPQSIHVASNSGDLEMIAGGPFVSSPVGNGGSDHTLGYYGNWPTNGNHLSLNLKNTSVAFWPCSSPAISPSASGLTTPQHPYQIVFGTEGGQPFFAVTDARTGAAVGSSPYVCTTSIWGSGKYMGTGVSTGGIANSAAYTFRDFGAAGALSTTFKYGWSGGIGPIANFAGTFPFVGGVPSPTVLSQMATGAIDPCTAPPAGSVVSCYRLNDLGTYADATGNFSALTATGTPVAASPGPAPVTILANEKPSGLTFAIDSSTIVLSGQAICYNGAPATGTAYLDGTWASDSGAFPSRLVIEVRNSSGTVIATQPLSAENGGLWSAAIAGIPWGTGYYFDIAWQNSSGRIYTSRNTFNIGLLIDTDNQSELNTLNSVAFGPFLGNAGEADSVIQALPTGQVSYNYLGDEPNGLFGLRALDAVNTPGQTTPYQVPANFAQVAGSGVVAIGKELTSWSGCPVTYLATGRNGHPRAFEAGDRITVPSAYADVVDNEVWTNTGAQSWAADVYSVLWGQSMFPFILPGSLSISIPYAGGAVTMTDNSAGVLSASDGSTGLTNYGFNEIATDTSALFDTLGLNTSNIPSNNHPSAGYYYYSIACEVNSSCQQYGSKGQIYGDVTSGLTSSTTFSANGNICIDQPNTSAALTSLCPAGANFAVTSGETIGTLISAINAAPIGALVQASLATVNGAAGTFALTPVVVGGAPVDIVINTASPCPGCSFIATRSTDVETVNNSGVQRGAYAYAAASTPHQRPDGFGNFGDGVNCSTGWVTQFLCMVRAPMSGYFLKIGAADDLPGELPYYNSLLQALAAKYQAATNARALTTPWIISLAERNSTAAPQTFDWGLFTAWRLALQQLASAGGSIGLSTWNGGQCWADITLLAFSHPSGNYGGQGLTGQCVGKSMESALTGETSQAWSMGPTIVSAARDTTYTGCSTLPVGSCIKVTLALGAHDTAVSTQGGYTAATGSGPSACVAGTVYTSGDVKAICMSAASPDAYAPYAASTPYQVSDIWSQAQTPCVSPCYSGGYLFQVTSSGFSSTTAQIMTQAVYLAQTVTDTGATCPGASLSTGAGGDGTLTIPAGGCTTGQIGVGSHFTGSGISGSTGVNLVIGSGSSGSTLCGSSSTTACTGTGAAGTYAVSTSQTVASSTLTVAGHADSYMGYLLAFSNSMHVMPGEYFTSGAYVYQVISAIPATPADGLHSCSGFQVGPSGAETELDGYNPYTTLFTGPNFTCTITGSNTVELINTAGWGSGQLDLYYDAGDICTNTLNPQSPTLYQCLAGQLTGNEGLEGMPNAQTIPGMLAQPVLTPMTVN